jgi:N6-L-threonylcarbamoyladenine synthase
LNDQKIADIALAFQDAAIDCLVEKSLKAMLQENCDQLVLSGGVAANSALRKKFKIRLKDNQDIFYPDIAHCTDNGVMIAFTGFEKLNFENEEHKILVNPRWNLEDLNER